MQENWFDLPKLYLIGKPLPVKNFIPATLEPAKKKKLKQAVCSINLYGQIYGEDIPSRINVEINCQVLLFLNIETKDIKDASFLGRYFQETIKSFCIIHFFDKKNYSQLAFSLKRLNKLYPDEVVIDRFFLYDVPSYNSQLPFVFNQIQNRTDKYLFYLELFTRYLILMYRFVWSELTSFFSTNLFYNEEQMKVLIDLIFQGVSYNQALEKADTINEKASINSRYKSLMVQLAQLKEGVS